MNNLALKDEVSNKQKMSQRPRILGLRNVMFNSFTSYISNRPKKLTWTPKMSFAKVSSQPRMLLHNSICRIPFEKLKRLRNTHSSRNFNKQMDMIWLNRKFINLKSMFTSNFLQNFFAKHFKFEKLKGIFSIFGLPNKVKSILSCSVSKFLYIHFFISCARFLKKAHSTTTRVVECASFTAHSLFSFKNLKNYRRLDAPYAKAYGI